MERAKRELKKEGVDFEKMLQDATKYLEDMKAVGYSLREAKLIVAKMGHILEVSEKYSPQTLLVDIPLRSIPD